MYTDWKVGDIVSIGVKVEDFCGTQGNYLWLNSRDMQLYPTPINITCNRPDCSYYCIDTRNIEVVFYSCMNYHTASNDVNCSYRNVGKYYRELGRIRTDINGISSFNHQVSETDIGDYNDAISLGGQYNIVACVNDVEAMIGHAANFGNVTISPYVPVTPTHYISLSMGFVPLEVMDYFDTYIAEISNRIMSYLSPLPSPWQYVSTTYDRVSNSFKIWVYSPSALGLGGYTLGIMDDLQRLWNWLSYWMPFLLGIILIILGIVGSVFAAVPVWLALLASFGGISILTWKIFDVRTQQLKLEDKAKNSDVQNQQNNKENKENQANDEKWNQSPKKFDNCAERLEGRKVIHDGIISGYIAQYGKYATFVAEMKTEKDLYIQTVDGIINDFKTKPYSVDVCNSYFINMINAGNSSNIRIADLIGRYINIDDPYVPPSYGYGNKADCEAAGYSWYDNKCHETGACWIQGPLDTCILSARVGKGILTAGGLLVGGYLLYRASKSAFKGGPTIGHL